MTETRYLITLQQQLAEKFEVTVTATTFEQFSKHLAVTVMNLILNDMNKLLNILYRVDVDEEKVLKIIRENPLPDASQYIADALISRQLEKIKQRESRSTPPDIPDNEKW